jgi:hypothetical protein
MVRARAESKPTGARAGMRGKAAMVELALGRDGATTTPAMAAGRPEEKAA